MFSDDKALEYFISIQDQLQPTMAIEVGAHDADFAKMVVKRNIPVFAFEASPYVYEKHKDGMDKIQYINKAITDYDGSIVFNFNGDNLPKSNVGNHSIKHRNLYEESENIIVPCTSLNSYFKDMGDESIALWIDCEGANREVLKGSSEILPKVSSIFIEVEHKQIWIDSWIREDVIKYLESFGFSLIWENQAYTDQTNCIFIS